MYECPSVCRELKIRHFRALEELHPPHDPHLRLIPSSSFDLRTRAKFLNNHQQLLLALPLRQRLVLRLASDPLHLLLFPVLVAFLCSSRIYSRFFPLERIVLFIWSSSWWLVLLKQKAEIFDGLCLICWFLSSSWIHFVFDSKEYGGSWACDSWAGLFSLFLALRMQVFL